MRSAAATSSAPVADPSPVPVQPSRTPRVSALALGLTAWAGLAACSGDSSSEFAGDLFVESCSIGCNNGSNGQAVTCSIINVTENQEISILFSEPIDPATITPSTLQVTDTQNGTAPEGLRFVDPIDPRRVVFRPSISFEGGGIEFAFGRNETYEILIPGVAQGDAGPFIRSTEGNPNQSRMMCSIQTTEGIADIVPGNPVVQVSVDVVTEFDPMGEPLTVERRVIDSNGNNPVEPVWRDSKVYFDFNELMFLPTVADNTTMSSPFIRVQFDSDGLLSTAGSERFDIPGSYEFTVDQIALTTQMIYTPEGTIPSAGSDPTNPRLLIVRIPSDVTDAAGNPITSQTGGGILVAIPEAILFNEVFFPSQAGETFDDTTSEDENATGANWADSGILSIGLSGGSGRHGELRLDEGETITLNTTSQDFPLTTVSQPDVIGNGPAGSYPRSITATDGVFEFSKIILGAQSRLVIEGTNPARLLSRGSCNIEPSAVIDVSGISAPAHDSTIPKVQGELDPALGGPNGAPGGQGADRWDAMQSTGFVGGLGGVEVPGVQPRWPTRRRRRWWLHRRRGSERALAERLPRGDHDHAREYHSDGVQPHDGSNRPAVGIRVHREADRCTGWRRRLRDQRRQRRRHSHRVADNRRSSGEFDDSPGHPRRKQRRPGPCDAECRQQRLRPETLALAEQPPRRRFVRQWRQ